MTIPLSHLNHLLHCTICTEKFNEAGRRPKLLQCGHTFCMDCLLELFKRALQLNTSENNAILRCPSCRQTTLLFDFSCVSQLSDNFAIISIFNCLSAEDPENYCKKHKDEKIKFFCDECQRLLCPSCALQHVSQKLHKVENAESAALMYRQQIHLAINDCKEKQKRLDEIIQKATEERLGLESLSKSLDHLAISTNDMEFLSQKQVLKQLREYSCIATAPQTLLQEISQSHNENFNMQNSLAPPGFWCSPSSTKTSQRYSCLLKKR